MSLFQRCLLAFAAVSLLPLAGFGVVVFVQTRSALTDQIHGQLQGAARRQRLRVETLLDQQRERLTLVCSRTQMRLSLRDFLATREASHVRKVRKIICDAAVSIPDFRVIRIFDLQGNLVTSTEDSESADAWEHPRLLREGRQKIVLGDYFVLKDGTAAVHLAGPLWLDGERLGVVAVETALPGLSGITGDYTGLGETGETLLATRDAAGNALFLTHLRFDRQAALKRAVRKDRQDVPIIRALASRSERLTKAIDYRGEPVLAVTQYLPGPDLGVVVKIDLTEAHAPVRRLAVTLVWAALGAIGAVVALAHVSSRSIVRPVQALTDAAARIRRGDLDHRAEVPRQRELRQLAATFNEMAQALIAANETERYARELQRSNEELEQFAYVTSHDLREPLRMVYIYTGLLAEDYAGRLDEDADKYIHYATDGARRMQALIDDLLNYSRVGRTDEPFGEVDLNAAAGHAVENLAAAISESGARVEMDNLPTVVGIATRMTQLFQNLIGNALKYRGDHAPVVHVGCRRVDGYWEIAVEDNGIGIAPKCQDRIFQIFQRLHTRDEYSGTGIGLAVCKKIVGHHQGRIWVESTPGKGSTFRFTLPAGLPTDPTDGHTTEQRFRAVR